MEGKAFWMRYKCLCSNTNHGVKTLVLHMNVSAQIFGTETKEPLVLWSGSSGWGSYFPNNTIVCCCCCNDVMWMLHQQHHELTFWFWGKSLWYWSQSYHRVCLKTRVSFKVLSSMCWCHFWVMSSRQQHHVTMTDSAVKAQILPCEVPMLVSADADLCALHLLPTPPPSWAGWCHF